MQRKPWTLEELKEEALKYKSRSEFYKKASGAYSAASRSNVLDEICEHMNSKYTKWTTKKILEKVRISSTYQDFKNNYPNAYRVACRKHMIEMIQGYYGYTGKAFWTPEKVKEVASKCSSKYDFIKKHRGAYNAAYRDNYLDELLYAEKELRIAA